TRSELVAAFAGLTRKGIKVGAAIHTVSLRVGRTLGARLSGVRQYQDQTHRKAGNQAHGGLQHVAMGRPGLGGKPTPSPTAYSLHAIGATKRLSGGVLAAGPANRASRRAAHVSERNACQFIRTGRSSHALDPN